MSLWGACATAACCVSRAGPPARPEGGVCATCVLYVPSLRRWLLPYSKCVDRRPLTHFSPRSLFLAGSSVTQIAYAQTTHLWQRYNYRPLLTATEASQRVGGGKGLRLVPHPARHRPLPSAPPRTHPPARAEGEAVLPPRVEPSASGAGGHCVQPAEVGAPGGSSQPRAVGSRAEGCSRPLPRLHPDVRPRAALHVPPALEDKRQGDTCPGTPSAPGAPAPAPRVPPAVTRSPWHPPQPRRFLRRRRTTRSVSAVCEQQRRRSCCLSCRGVLLTPVRGPWPPSDGRLPKTGSVLRAFEEP